MNKIWYIYIQNFLNNILFFFLLLKIKTKPAKIFHKKPKNRTKLISIILVFIRLIAFSRKKINNIFSIKTIKDWTKKWSLLIDWFTPVYIIILYKSKGNQTEYTIRLFNNNIIRKLLLIDKINKIYNIKIK